MQRNNLAEGYDLEDVTARLEAMKARRRKWQSRKNGDSEQQQQLVEGGITTVFDLAPADLSSGGSDGESDDGYLSSSTDSLPSDDDKAKDLSHHSRTSKLQQGRGRPRRLRVTDSLDLSMSVAMSDGPSLQAEVLSSSNANQHATRVKVPREESIQKSSSCQHIGGKAVSRVKSENSVANISRIPKLVQQRRQLHADTQHAAASHHATGSSYISPSEASRVSVNKGQRRNSPPISGNVVAPEPPKQVTAPHSTRSPTRGISNPGLTTVANLKANVPEEIDPTAAEERRILQSLEKLDQRLTSVCAPVVAVCEQTSHMNTVTSRFRANTETSSSVSTANGKIHGEILRAAAYGGGTHCKLHQPASVSVRSSSAKRAELSNGVHKSRVRVGGAFINDARRSSSTDGSGKHKIVVKKDLAYLLF